MIATRAPARAADRPARRPGRSRSGRWSAGLLLCAVALGLLAGGSTGCGPGTPTAFRIYVYYDRAELDVRQVSVQVGFLPEGPGAPSVLPAEMQGPLDQGSSVGLVFDEADSGRAALVVLTALGPGGVPVGVQSLSLVTPAIGMIEDQFVGFGTSPPLPPPGQVGP